MLTIMRGLKIPARYVSGYLARNFDKGTEERSDKDQSHAWVEGWLPDLGWVGFDPTNNLLAGNRHVRVAVGRDYADVPPTRGVFIGNAETELTVGVYIGETDAPAPKPADLLPNLVWEAAPSRSADSQWQAQQQQQ
jgi:transglutaminase-like putative cysteine protease